MEEELEAEIFSGEVKKWRNCKAKWGLIIYLVSSHWRERARERERETEWKLGEEAGFGNENSDAKGVFKVVHLYFLFWLNCQLQS